MKTLYFDCSSGISGNMVLGALTELTGDREYLVRELEKLHIDGYRIEYSSREKNGIMGTPPGGGIGKKGPGTGRKV